MSIEQVIIEKLRKLPIEKQQEVLNFTESLTKNHSLPSPDPNLTPKERAEKWRRFVDSHSSDNSPLPESALHRDTMYED
jgi:hypothetical protein